MFGVRTRRVERTNHIHKGKERNPTIKRYGIMDNNYHKNKTRNSPDKEQSTKLLRNPKFAGSAGPERGA